MSQTERLYWIDGQIRSGRYPNAKVVCDQFEVSRRTAYADRDHLIQRLGAPLVLDRRRGGWVYRDPTFVLPFLALSEREAAILRRSLLAAQEYLPSSEAEPVLRLAQRLHRYVPPLGGPAPESMAGAIHPAPALSASPALLDDCRRAVQERQRLRLLYHGLHRDALTDRIVQPYHLLHWRGEPYLIAWCELRRDLRDFFLGRVREWTLLPRADSYQRDPTFDVTEYLRAGFDVRHGEDQVTVRVRFSPYQARWVRERQYHPSQEAEDEPDGGLRLTLRVAGTAEIKRWLLGYGAEAEVLEPAELRAELGVEAKKLAEIYGAP